MATARTLTLSNHSLHNLNLDVLDLGYNKKQKTDHPRTTDTVLFNIGGQYYRISKSLLNTQPHSMLARSASEQWHQQRSFETQGDKENAIFIDRNGARFQYVLDYLRDGRIFLPLSECRESILSELDFYAIDYEDEYIMHSPSSQGVAMGGLKLLQNQILKWRCADLAADIVEAAWKDAKWTGREGDRKYLSFEPHRFKELCYQLKQEDAISWTNEHLMTLGLKITSLELDMSCEKCRVTVQIVEEQEVENDS